MKKSKPNEPAYVAATLRWCNAMRKERGKGPLKRLPKGTRYDGRSCPCGKATGLDVQEHEWTPEKGSWVTAKKYPLPLIVTTFVLSFDAGKLPQYELKP